MWIIFENTKPIQTNGYEILSICIFSSSSKQWNLERHSKCHGLPHQENQHFIIRLELAATTTRNRPSHNVKKGTFAITLKSAKHLKNATANNSGHHHQPTINVLTNWPCSTIPCSIHFLNLQYWHRFLCAFVISQLPSATHVYTLLFCTVRLKKPLQPSHVMMP